MFVERERIRPTSETVPIHEELRYLALRMAAFIETVRPPGRETAQAVTALEGQQALGGGRVPASPRPTWG